MVGGLSATAAGYAGQGIGIGFEEAGFEFGENLKDKSAGLTEFGIAATSESAGQIGEAVEDTFTPGGEVVGGVYHAGTNAESIIFDWSDEDNEGDDGKGWAYRNWEWQRVDWDEERASNIEMMKQDDHGWTGDSLVDAIWGGTLGSGADAWTDIVAEGTLAADDELQLRGYETAFQEMTWDERHAWIASISDEVILSCVIVGGGGIAGLRALWAAGGVTVKVGTGIFVAVLTAGRFGMYSLPDVDINTEPYVPEEEDEEVEDDEVEEDGTLPFDPEDEGSVEEQEAQSEDKIREEQEKQAEAEAAAAAEAERRAEEERLIRESQERRREEERLAKIHAGAPSDTYNPYQEHEAVW
jgi:hypothetical protein